MKKLLLCLAIGLMLQLAGCSVDAKSSGGTEVPNGPGKLDISGPYAEEFQNEFNQLTDEKFKGYLKDGKISEAEFQAVLADYSDCLASYGITFQGYDENGVASLEGDTSRIENGDIQARMGECSESSGDGVISYLYFMVQRDPNGEITPESQVECWVRAGIVPPDFTLDDQRNGGLDKLHPPEIRFGPGGEEVSTKIQDCQNDPLHAYSE